MAILRSPNFAEATPPWLVQADDNLPPDDETADWSDEDWRDRDGDLAYDREREEEQT